MKRLDFDKIEFSDNHPSTKDALQDIEPFFTPKEVRQLCDELGIVWDENATKATLNGKPVTVTDIERAFKVQFDKE